MIPHSDGDLIHSPLKRIEEVGLVHRFEEIRPRLEKAKGGTPIQLNPLGQEPQHCLPD